MIRLLPGDCRSVLATLPADSVHTVVTSPPYYGLRDYGTALWDGGDAACDHTQGLVPVSADDPGIRCSTLEGGKRTTTAQAEARSYRDTCGKCGARRIDRQIGLEATPDEYLATMVAVFRAIRRVLRPDGTCWVNMSGGYQNKQLDMMPARLALALQADDWVLRSDIIWHKPGPMPESVRDRPTSAHEHLFLLSKSSRYYFDLEAIKEASGANCRNVWTIASFPFSGWTETSRRLRVAWDAAVDGKKRKASPDCPVHGDRSAQAPNVHDGGRADGSLIRIARNGVDPAQAPAGDCAPSAQHREPMSAEQSSGSLPLSRSPSATLRSNQSHRTDLALGTSQPCSASAQTGDGTVYTSMSPSPSGSAARMLESNSALDGLADGRNSQTARHSADSSRESLALFSASDPSHCTCEWYVEKTEKTSHFATFPPALAERCIRAGTSERGCCAQCGKPWIRVVTESKGGKRSWHDHAADQSLGMRQVKQGQAIWDSYTPPSTTGWQPGCSHDADIVPCAVLDPFAGAGTTLLCADRLQRDAIGIELNVAYTQMAMDRCRADAPLFADMADAPVPEPPEDQRIRDLFSDMAAD